MRIEPLVDHPQAIPTLSAWLYEEWGYLEPQSSRDWVAERLAERLQTATVPICFVALLSAVEGPKLVGTVSVKFREMDIYPQLNYWVGSLFVAPAQRGCGIGSALMQHVAAWGIEQQISALHLYTQDQASLYAKLGWQTIASPVYRGRAATVMRLDLS